ncbi:MAG: 50S ribosomal protein L10 [Candidatus Omnitrophota bacterium]|nr:MAG: 50S ribosomal protein L10 [Candidatus Omnitrophota bacterium]
MKRLGLYARKQITKELKTKFKEAEACFFVGFNKINAFSLNTMRNDFRKSEAAVFVTKNSLLKRTLDDLGWTEFNGFLEGETGIIFVYDADIIKTCKILVEFSRENEAFRLKGGMLKNKKIAPEEVKNLAKLPSKEILLGMAVNTLSSPLTGFLAAMNQVILKFVWAVKEIKEKKDTTGERSSSA